MRLLDRVISFFRRRSMVQPDKDSSVYSYVKQTWGHSFSVLEALDDRYIEYKVVGHGSGYPPLNKKRGNKTLTATGIFKPIKKGDLIRVSRESGAVVDYVVTSISYFDDPRDMFSLRMRAWGIPDNPDDASEGLPIYKTE